MQTSRGRGERWAMTQGVAKTARPDYGESHSSYNVLCDLSYPLDEVMRLYLTPWRILL